MVCYFNGGFLFGRESPYEILSYEEVSSCVSKILQVLNE